ncbi:MAG: hypothetical protein SWX82_11105 [Cyanobacteriota bacterium]|nr:hypothetical protein [Cyanobacteriota bacterium]
MDDDNLEIPPISMQRKKSSISLSVDRDAFTEFVVSLLGKPELVEGYVEGAFEIDFGGFEQLNYIIDDRITKQNQSVLVEFRAKLFLNDNSSLSFSGVKSFQEYKERRSLICTGFIFTWVYLVEFHDKKVPERQEISVSSVEEGIPSSTKSKSREKESISEIFDIGFVDQIPKISYSIRCTNKGWGIEIAELVRNCITGFVKTDVPFAGFRRNAMENPIVLGNPSFILCFLLLLIFFWIYTEERLTSCRIFSDKTGQFIGTNIPLGEKVDFLIKFFDTCREMNSTEGLIFFVVALLTLNTSFLLPMLILRLIKLPTYRFVTFTEASKKERDKYFRRVSNRKNFWWIVVVAGLIIGVSASILASYLLEWLGNTFG